MANKMTFEEWKKQVDHFIGVCCGLTSEDLSDYCYADAYEQGKKPFATAKLAIKATREF